MDLAEVTVGEEGDGEGLATCGGAPRCHGRVSDDGEAVAVWLACARWRGRRGEAGGAGELTRDGL